MKRSEVNGSKRWLVMLVIMLLVAVACITLLKFDISLVLGILLVEGFILRALGEKLETYLEKEQGGGPQLSFTVVSLSILGLALYILGQAVYTEKISVWRWLTNKVVEPTRYCYLDFELGLMLVIFYMIWLVSSRDTIWKLARKNINKWLPSMWGLIGGLVVSLYFKETMEHRVATLSLIIGICLLGIWSIYINLISKDEQIKYKIHVKSYLAIFTLNFMVVLLMSIGMPKVYELPGTRWIRHTVSELFGQSLNIDRKVPEHIYLADQVPHSEAELFQIRAGEKLYLRDMAYSHYQDNIWSITDDEEEKIGHTKLKPNYLEAEYNQLNGLLEQILWLHSQDKSLFQDYAWLNNYEKSVVTKKRYTVIQNPINKVNYFTVNSFEDIKDAATKNIYYYKEIDHCYFYGDKVIEPTQYEVTYYDRVPKVGSREYAFLHHIDGDKWEALYNEVLRDRCEDNLVYETQPPYRLTYMQLVQYKKAKQDDLQLPSEMAEKLHPLASTITAGEKSDWGRAEKICQYLKENYTYVNQSKKEEQDKVLNFLFEQKEGVCQEFASSMVLMCRSIDIPARYVTGYLATEKDPATGNYIIREKDAHAFVEVYIPGYGWMNFDPTPQGDNAPSQNHFEEERQDANIMNMPGIWAILIIILAGSKHVRRHVKEGYRNLHYLFVAPNKQIKLLLVYTLDWLQLYGIARLKYETLYQYAARVKEKEIDIYPIIEVYQNLKYGHITPKKEELKAAQECYKELKRQISKK